jgi:hypothetical protein
MASITFDRFFLGKNDIKALCAFASSDVDRPALAHVVFDAYDGRIFATDGHTLVRVTPRRADFLPSRAPFRFGVPHETLESLSRTLARGHELAVYMSAGKIVLATVHETSRDVPVATSEVAYDAELGFPYYEQVIPERPYEDPGSSTAFNAEYLARLWLIQRAAGTRGLDAFAPEGPLDAVRFETSHDGTEWLVVIMPFRSDRALTLDAESRRRRSSPKLSQEAEDKLGVPVFHRLVERMARLSLAEIAAVEQLLGTFAPGAAQARGGVMETSCLGGLA